MSSQPTLHRFLKRRLSCWEWQWYYEDQHESNRKAKKYKLHDKIPFENTGDLREYRTVSPDQCTYELIRDVNKYLGKWWRSDEWSFVCQIRDGQKRLPKILSDFGKFATYVVVERYETCYCSTPGIHARLMDKAARGPAAERVRYDFGESDDSDNGDAGEQAEAPPAYGDLT